MSNLIGKGYKERWYPNSISSIEIHLYKYKIDKENCPNEQAVRSNISYNIQYLEYLRKTLNELNLTSVLQIQTIKSFIVISTSIIEAVFYLICCQENLRKKLDWREFKITKTQNIIIDTFLINSETKVFEKIENVVYEELTFTQMTQKIENGKILDIDNQFFKDLNHLRKLRNKIHLQENVKVAKTDYKTFWLPEYKLAKKNLKLLLTNKIFGEYDIILFEFLNTKDN